MTDRTRSASSDANRSFVANDWHFSYAASGTGVSGFKGDGGSATAARIAAPYNVTPLSVGSFLIADNHRVRKVSAAGTISTVAGTGVAGFSGDGGLPTHAMLFLAPRTWNAGGRLAGRAAT